MYTYTLGALKPYYIIYELETYLKNKNKIYIRIGIEHDSIVKQ